MRVVRVEDGLAVCEAEGEQREVEIALLDAVAAGDVLLVHADVGLVRLG
jgi:hydrogenase maturation factor